MSPQQAAGVTDLDARADVYGLAAMIYEMLIGEVLPPGQWPGEDAVRAGRFRDVPAQHRTRLDELGSDVEAALLRGLSLRREQRTATPRSLSMSSPAAPLPRGGAIRKQRFRRLCAARRSDLTLPVVADRWRAGDRIEILYLPDRGYDSVIATGRWRASAERMALFGACRYREAHEELAPIPL